VAAAMLALTGGTWAADLPVIRWDGRTMGSPYTVQVVGANLTAAQAETLKAEVEARLREVNRQMSHYQAESELSQFNRAPAHQPFKVSPEFARVVRFALELSRRSEGAFDPTLAPVINLWGFGERTEQQAIPSDADLKLARQQTGWQHLAVTANDELVKTVPELKLNLSAVAKGFGVDEMGRVLRRHGLTNIYAAVAGEVLVWGCNPRGMPWHLGLVAPLDHWREGDPMAAGILLSNQAVSTSGDYQKFFFSAQGQRLSHILDPRSGRPVQHNVAGVSVVAPDGMTADALATTLFVLGVQRGLQFIEAWPEAGALFIVREGKGHFRRITSPRFPALLDSEP
jgi:thiamine biosynthesis lipoprotein